MYIPDDGPDTGQTARTFEDRYGAIQSSVLDLLMLRELSEDFSVVDFGAYNGRMARQLCDRFGVSGTAIDDHEGLRGDTLVTPIYRTVSARELGAIIREASGDTVVLALSVLHHLPDWKKYVGVIERNARYAFIETANSDEVLPEAVAHDQSSAITTWCEKRGTVIHESPGWDNRFMRLTWFMEFQ